MSASKCSSVQYSISSCLRIAVVVSIEPAVTLGTENDSGLLETKINSFGERTRTLSHRDIENIVCQTEFLNYLQ